MTNDNSTIGNNQQHVTAITENLTEGTANTIPTSTNQKELFNFLGPNNGLVRNQQVVSDSKLTI